MMFDLLFDPTPETKFLDALEELVRDARESSASADFSDRSMVLRLILFSVASAGVVGLTPEQTRLAVEQQLSDDAKNAGRGGDRVAMLWGEERNDDVAEAE